MILYYDVMILYHYHNNYYDSIMVIYYDVMILW